MKKEPAKVWDPMAKDVMPPFWELYSKFGGQTYALPVDGDVLLLQYRKDLFENAEEQAAFKAKYGKDLKVPETWEDYLQVGEFFTRKKGDKLAGETLDHDFYGLAEYGERGFSAYWFLNRFASSGGMYFDKDMKSTINTPHISLPPYNIANYPPFFILVQVPFVWIFGPALWYGRLISLLCTLLAALFTGLTIWSLVRDRLAAIAGGLLLLVIPYVLHWSPLTRIDNLALALLAAGLFTIAHKPESRKRRILAAVLLLLAIYTRQSYGLAGPLAVFMFLLLSAAASVEYQPDLKNALRQGWHQALEFALWLGGLGLALFLLLNLLTKGGFFFHIVTANVNPFYWETVQRYANDIWGYMPFLVVGSLGLILWGGREALRFWRQGNRSQVPPELKKKPDRLVRQYTADRRRSWWLAVPFLLGATVSAITIGKDGSNVNYLLELCAALCLASGVLIAWAGQESRAFKIALLVVLALQVSLILDWSRETYATYHTGRFNQEPQLYQLNQAIQRAPEGDILADEHMAMVAVNGRPIVFQPFEFKMLAEAGKWDQAAFVQSLRDKQYPMILLYDPESWDSQHARWTQEQLDAIYENYQTSTSLADTLVFKPKR